MRVLQVTEAVKLPCSDPFVQMMLSLTSSKMVTRGSGIASAGGRVVPSERGYISRSASANLPIHSSNAPSYLGSDV